MRLGNRDKFDVIRFVPSFRRRLCDLFANPFEIFGDCAHGW
jgi:hypothetical protein